eukprot:12021172-Alexandrium_andersonii.AAC.1
MATGTPSGARPQAASTTRLAPRTFGIQSAHQVNPHCRPSTYRTGKKVFPKYVLRPARRLTALELGGR